ncbi:MAG: single-stranded-DNA-specific exonuclease RecJ [Oscillospiraceae bacterium]|nr:single-stranded-DNA-specific exonuclease RecJ [Oscillospiraceae bacterium]
MKKWTIGDPDKNAAAALAAQGGLSRLCADILVSRGIDTYEKAAAFFDQDSSALSDPFEIKDMKKAAEIILEAAESGKKICVYGDYDCDGITAAALLYSYLDAMGADVCYHINDRSQGYGMCCDAVRQLAEDGAELIVTVDNGISAIEEAKLAKELGIALVITDHHEAGDILPEAAAVVDPKRHDDESPFKDMCGCGIALKLIAAMEDGDYSFALEHFSDLAAIATIADIVPLRGENREIVRMGLHYLKNTENPGLQALMSAAKVSPPISSTDAAFYLAPRINAAGRMSSALEALKLLLCDDPDEAAEIAERINRYNNERKKTEDSIAKEIQEHIANDPNILYERVLFVYGKGWHHGVIGIVASRLLERFGKPVFLLSDDGEFARGSARAPKGFSVFDALTACSDTLTKFGGHQGAGGYTLTNDNIEAFRKALLKYAAEEFNDIPLYTLHADKMLIPSDMTVEAISSLSALEPCGEGNPRPLFALLSAEVSEVVPLSEGAHTKLILSYGGVRLTGLMFNRKSSDFPYQKGDALNLIGYPEINTYRGTTEINFNIKDYHKSGIPQKKYFAAKGAYEDYKTGAKVNPALLARMVPARNDLAAVYKAVPTCSAAFDAIYSAVCSDDLNYGKFRLALDIFEEMGLISQDIYNETAMRLPAEKKVDLNDSKILKELNASQSKS